ncbi:MAG: hypothetical protein ACE5FF_14045 [Saprospiraceae bacterium]
MDLQKAKILLEKINALYNSMSADEKNISNIERDLMKSYVQQFYDTLLAGAEAAPKQTPAPVEIIKTTPKVSLRKQAPPPKAEEVAKAPEVTPVRPAPAPEKEAPRPKKEAPAPTPVVTKPAAPSPIPVPLPNTKVSAGLEELFSFGSAKELSEKLSELPITDIKKAMGLNERIFTVNELFGGKQAAFDETLNALNQLKSFEEAKQYLMQNAATQFDWAAKTRKNKAKTFIKLVKRRFN